MLTAGIKKVRAAEGGKKKLVKKPKSMLQESPIIEQTKQPSYEE